LASSLSLNLRTWREQFAKMSIDEVSKKAILKKIDKKTGKPAHVSPSYIRSLENGNRDNVTLEVLEAIAKAEGTEAGLLLLPGIPVQWLSNLPEIVINNLSDKKKVAVMKLTAEALERGYLDYKDYMDALSFAERLSSKNHRR
jgi:transcriptional regulator with XRE-family HTH domain